MWCTRPDALNGRTAGAAGAGDDVAGWWELREHAKPPPESLCTGVLSADLRGDAEPFA